MCEHPVVTPEPTVVRDYGKFTATISRLKCLTCPAEVAYVDDRDN